ncbi:MAG TPA: tetratricopeptide repeat protein [Pirellulaceae bacterium]|nr:tetratricopeptide repeat protein [Pirellulaceae bacterium]
MRKLLLTLAAISLGLVAGPAATLAQNAGQEDLDKATELQITAETLGELEQVIKLAETALDKGLDKGQTEFAKKLLGATLFQHAERSARSVFEQIPPSRNWRSIRDQGMKNLAKAKKFDPTLPDVYLLEAKFQALPGGETRDAIAALDEAIKLLKPKDQPKQLADAYVLRAQFLEDDERKLADYDEALKVQPKHVAARQARALHYLTKGENEKAIADFQKLLEQDADNPGVIAELARALILNKKFDEAMKYCEEVIKLAPKATEGYKLRAQLRWIKEDTKGALEDLGEALSINPNDISGLLMRCRLYASEKKDALAKADLDRVLRLRPDLPQAIELRSTMAALKQNYADAIADIQTLLQGDPTNPELRLQLASYYVGDKRPRKAIELITSVIDGLADDKDAGAKENKADALRQRGDALLSVGKHADAVKDYEEALKLDPNDTGVLNNLAWVLATSPDDPVRNAKRSLECSLKACELTKYEKPHILSTLAAGYAEQGDWETAIKWSGKAVELGVEEVMVDDQLKKELQSYKDKKPWREKQEVEENTKPLGKKSDLET